MTPSEVLRAARAKIDTPEKWTQGRYSRDRNGVWVGLHAGVKFCTVGALACAVGKEDPRGFEESDIAHFFERAIGVRCIVEWNDADERTHAEILAAFDKAIALAEAEEGA